MSATNVTIREDEASRAFGRLRFLVYSLALSSAAFQMAIVPLLPEYAKRYALSSFQQGMLLSAIAFSTLAVSLPAGTLADRFGPRRLTVAAAWLMALAMVMQAISPTFLWLLTSRLVFGAGYGIIWTAGLAWLAGASPKRSALGGTVVASGLGGILGPLLAGTLAQGLGLAAPWWLGAAVFVAFAVALVVFDLPRPAVKEDRGAGLLSGLAGMARNRSIVAALATVIAAGLTWSVAYLLVPDQLQGAGLGAGSTGLILAAAAVVYLVGSMATASLGTRAVRVKVVGYAMLALGLTFAPLVVDSAPTALAIALCGGALARSILWTAAYPLAARGAEERGLGIGTVMGAMQATWAATSVACPLLAGAAAGSAGAPVIYALTMLATLTILAVTAAWILRRQVTLRARLVLGRAGITI